MSSPILLRQFAQRSVNATVSGELRQLAAHSTSKFRFHLAPQQLQHRCASSRASHGNRARNEELAALVTMDIATTPRDGDYKRWTKEALVSRVKWLEDQLKRRPPSAEEAAAAEELVVEKAKKLAKKKPKKKIDPSKYSTRLVALKLAYLGKNYNGFEYQTTGNPTIEEELWKAMVKSCLISPENPEEVNFTPFEYYKCGRTDRGVSAFGQVISIRLRSSQPPPRKEGEEAPTAVATEDASVDALSTKTANGTTNNLAAEEVAMVEVAESVVEAAAAQGAGNAKRKRDAVAKAKSSKPKPAWDPIADEIAYCKVLNRILPPDIRVIAWAPTLSPDFSARFSCRERQYRYYFTQPCFAPQPTHLESPRGASAMKDGWLDIEAMRKAAKMYEGLHDFRNFCKVDPGKQITNFWRRVFEADIVEVEDVGSALPYLNRPDLKPANFPDGPVYPKVYYFHVRASAFLWHQIRHMVSIIFSVGQGLEPPSLVSDLLDVNKNPRRPGYVLADDVPLVLWDCVFPNLDEWKDGQTVNEESIDWIWLGEDNPLYLHAPSGLVDHMWENWREKKIDELLAGQLLQYIATKPDLSKRRERGEIFLPTGQRVFEGGNRGNPAGRYTPVMKRILMQSVEEVNNKWAEKKGFASSEEMTANRQWRGALREAAKLGNTTIVTEEVDPGNE
ncbi:pseudouridine synthase [Podospora didyma]|uniref:Pseudouridine synthase n=1 Tax=Podospora didyma TaxID=330526 RepID=A0AAE0NSV5_9PEZI|nr:pseudouridine synthase [Podospora didyma]